jgi:hypothetical protein
MHRNKSILTKRREEKHLWVDLPCIVQDDPEHKIRIKCMDRIYRRAVMTTIAMSGTAAHAGLPGVKPFSKKATGPIESIERNKFCLTTKQLELKDIIDLSAYEERAWTFQERLLSRRCLYLTDWQAYFSCQLE